MKLYWLCLIAFGLMSAKTQADDTEIYLGTANRVNPNVIFIFDTSGSMGSCTGDTLTTGSNTLFPGQRANCVNNDRTDRGSVVRKAAQEVIRDISGINLGIMRFNGNNGGYVAKEIVSLDDSTNKADILDLLDGYVSNSVCTSWNANGDCTATTNVYEKMVINGNTPMVETTYEAARYFRGESPAWGANKSPSSIIRGGKYVSPITDQCQKNHIVLFTDGASTQDTSNDDEIGNWYESIPLADRPSASYMSSSCSTGSGSSCLEELAFYLNYSDNNGNPDDGKQRIHLHTIGGFNQTAQTILNRAATQGGGISAYANNYDALKTALTKIFDDIAQSAGTFAAPAVAVNAFNSLEQLDQMYYSVFKPHENVGWSGNIKRFRMTAEGIVDANDNDAIDPVTGFFSKNAQSIWTADANAPDGDNVQKGGITSHLTTNRRIVSNLTGNRLTDSANEIHEDNINLTPTLMGTSLSGDEFKRLVKWARGLDVKGSDETQPRQSMEDPLHSRPVLLNYGHMTDKNGVKIPDSTLFIGTNSGYLHAFDTRESNPQERFAFIPKDLLPVTTAYYLGGGSKQYGLDGHISTWHDDTNKNQIIDNNEKAYLYVGMRRGGSSYYALDVSDRDNPSLLWQINGAYHPSTTAGFSKLGQTWSRMVPADINWIDGNKRKVLIFGGGYDPKEDNYNVRTAHEAGNAIYMVDAITGKLLWKASSESSANLRLSEMTSSIVGDIVAVDDDSDGAVELLYAADLGGRIWRIDFRKSATSASGYATGGVIADMGQDNTEPNNVRFYNTPDVVYSKAFPVVKASNSGNVEQLNVPRYVISIGSGYRAHPLNDDAADNFYMIFDYNTEGAPSTYSVTRKTDIQGFSFNSSGESTITPSLKTNKGLYLTLKDASKGEKVLSKAVTLDNVVYFSSYRPVDPDTRSGCEPDTGKNRLYILNFSRNEGSQTGNSSSFTGSTQEATQSGITGDPIIILPKPVDGSSPPTPKVLISTEMFEAEDTRYPLKKTYWRELE